MPFKFRYRTGCLRNNNSPIVYQSILKYILKSVSIGEAILSYGEYVQRDSVKGHVGKKDILS